MKKYHVFSTLASDQRYRNHSKGPADLPQKTGEVLIHGGAGVANKHIVTPRGVMTTIDEDQYKILLKSHVFNQHHQNGFITVAEAAGDPDKVAKDMAETDPSRQPKPEDFGNDSSTAEDGVVTEGKGKGVGNKK